MAGPSFTIFRPSSAKSAPQRMSTVPDLLIFVVSMKLALPSKRAMCLSSAKHPAKNVPWSVHFG